MGTNYFHTPCFFSCGFQTTQEKNVINSRGGHFDEKITSKSVMLLSVIERGNIFLGVRKRSVLVSLDRSRYRKALNFALHNEL